MLQEVAKTNKIEEIPLNIFYKIEIRNRFRALLDTAEEMEPNEMTEEIPLVCKEAAAYHLPKKKSQKSLGSPKKK